MATYLLSFYFLGNLKRLAVNNDDDDDESVVVVDDVTGIVTLMERIGLTSFLLLLNTR